MGKRTTKGIFFLLPIFLAVLLCLVSVRAETAPLGEYEIKAVFLFNFARFVQWPVEVIPESQGPLGIYVIGPDPFGDALSSMAGKTVQGRKIAVGRLKEWESVPSGCNILFVNVKDRKFLDRILGEAEALSALTVSDQDGFLNEGGIVQLSTQKKKITMTISQAGVRKARLKISSSLLRLATVVEEVGK